MIVTFLPARNGGVMAKINGRVAFPDRRWMPPPEEGDEWEVEVAGENPAKTVYFLTPVRKIDREEERRQREEDKIIKAKEEYDCLFGKGKFEHDSSSCQGDQGWLAYMYNTYKGEIISIKREMPELEWGDVLGVIRIMTMTGYRPKDAWEVLQQRRADNRRWREEKAGKIERIRRLTTSVKQKDIEVEEIEVNEVEVKFHFDEDWGMHKADPGYSVTTSPIMPNLDYKAPHAFTSEIPLCRRLGFVDEGTTSLDLEEACEDGDELSLALDRLAMAILPWRWKLVKIRIPDKTKNSIREKYPDADGIHFNEPDLYARALGGSKLIWK